MLPEQRKMLSIGKLSFSIPCILAPISGVSDLPFRMINRSFGAPLAFTEMIDVRALSALDKRTRHMLSSNAEDRPLGVQLLASDSKDIVEALKALESIEYDIIDFNAACPTPKVVRKGKGALLLREPRKLKEILEVLVRYAKTPVTVKIRSGWDIDSVNAREVARYAEDAGVSALFIHGRTKAQGYSGTVDYETIKEVSDTLTIPVIASGDNLSVPQIKKMFEKTGCDGVAIARGSFGNPWIFKDLIQFFQDGSIGSMPRVNARVEVMKCHLNLLVQHYGEQRALSIFHKFFIWYTKGIRKTRVLRDKAFRIETMEDLVALIGEFRKLDDNKISQSCIGEE
jgi:tRNA-dihydrouridine synthase B